MFTHNVTDKSSSVQMFAHKVQMVNNPLIAENDEMWIQCKTNISTLIEDGVKYMIVLPELNTTLYVICTFVGINACDMKIKSIVKNGGPPVKCDKYTLSYRYADFDSIHYSSFSRKDKCILYTPAK